MTTPSSPDGRHPTEAAIASGVASGDTEAVLRAVATSTVMIPQPPAEPGQEPPEGSMTLPVIEQDGTQYVPVFTSAETMQEAGTSVDEAIPVPAAALGASWPSDELWLAINPGSEQGITLPPDAVKALPVFAAGAS